MALFDGFKNAHLFIKIAFITLFIADIFNWIAFTTVRWGEGRQGGVNSGFSVYGLWRICPKNGIGCVLLDGWGLTWYGCFQAFVTIGFLGLNLAFVFLILNMFVSSCSKHADMIFWAAIIVFITAVLYVIGVIIFAAEFSVNFIIDDALGFSFYLALLAIVMEIFAGIFLIIAAKQSGVSPV